MSSHKIFVSFSQPIIRFILAQSHITFNTLGDLGPFFIQLTLCGYFFAIITIQLQIVDTNYSLCYNIS